MSREIDLVIRQAQIVTPDGIIEGELGIDDGAITSVGIPVKQARRVIEAPGRMIMPGGVDVHAHIEQMSGMGQWNADTFETATRSAAMGGTTSVISFAAQAAEQTLAETLTDYAARAARGAMIDYAFHLTLTDITVPNFEYDLAALIGTGHRSLKVFTTYNIQLADAEILSVMDQARAAGALVCVHAENDAIIARARADLLAAGHRAPRDHARSRPRMAEIEAIERICRFAEYLDQPVMIFHVSTAEGVDAIRAAKARGAPVWCETCPHYLLMTEDVLDKPGLEGAKWMCSPPQRTQADQDALWAGLLEGTVSLVSSDHAPYRFDESGKLAAGANPDFSQIANGLPGLETRLPLLFDAMVAGGRGGPRAFAEATAQAPARLYGFKDKGALVPGKHADLVIWNPTVERTYAANDLHDNVGYNPWAGRTVRGWPEQVMLRGETLVENGKFLAQPGNGRWLDRPDLGCQPVATANGGTAP